MLYYREGRGGGCITERVGGVYYREGRGCFITEGVGGIVLQRG